VTVKPRRALDARRTNGGSKEFAKRFPHDRQRRERGVGGPADRNGLPQGWL